MGTAPTTPIESLRHAGRRKLDRWVRRRGPTYPPLRLGYRQIFILPTAFGNLLGALMTAMLIGSLNFNNNLGLLTTFIVAGLAVNSTLLAFRNLHGLRVVHAHAEPVFAGEPIRLQVTVANEHARSRPALALLYERERRPFAVEPRATRRVDLALPTHRRGWLPVGRMGIATTHPMGLFRAWSWFWPKQPVLVWPRPAEHPPPLPEDVSRETGGRLDTDVEGEEYHSLRKWREGDSLHRIAWKASQRHQTLLSREFRRERSHHLTLDVSQAPGSGREQRIAIVTAWVVRAEAENRSWTLVAEEQHLGPSRGREHRDRCLQALAEL